jgi:diadenylate cyclase
LWAAQRALKGTRSLKALSAFTLLCSPYFLTRFSAPELLSERAHEWALVTIIALTALLFAQELRLVMEQLGEPMIRLIKRSLRVLGHRSTLNQEVIDLLHDALLELARTKTGALIVIKRRAELRRHLIDGVEVDAKVSVGLLRAIFHGTNPLHDGAVVIEDNRIALASTFLPMSSRRDLNAQLGTRHRAGIGIAEVGDALALIVSEERGVISLAYQGELTEDLTPTQLHILLNELC